MSGQLAQMVRAKHPGAYDDLSDEQLEQAVVAKFPGVYDDLVQPSAVRTPSHPHAKVGAAVIDAAKGIGAGAMSTIMHGGDLIRRGVNAVMPARERTVEDVVAGREAQGFMDRPVLRPDVQDMMTPPDSLGGKVGFFGEQAAEFAVPLTKLAKITKGLGLGKRIAIDAASSAGVAAVQSGGDKTSMAVGGALGGALPIAGAGLRLVGGAAKRAAAGAAEGGVGGAVASAVRTVAPADSQFMLFQGLKPRNSRTGFMKSLQEAVPEIKASEAELGKPIESIDDLLTGVGLAKKRIRGQYDAIAGPARAIGTTVDLTPMADNMVTRIPKKLRLENPAQVEAIEAVAAKYRRAFPLEEAEQLLKETNADLEAFYNKFPLGQRRALAVDPVAMQLNAQAQGMRTAIYKTLDGPNQPAGARALNRLYGHLIEIEDTAVRRANVAQRQQPLGLNEQMAEVGAAADRAAGAYRIGRGVVTGSPRDVIGGGADLIRGQVRRETAKFIKEQQTTDALIRRAFAGVTAKPGVYAKPVQRPVKGLLERGAIPMESGPDGSYVRSVSAQPGESTRKALPPARTVHELNAAPDSSYVRSERAAYGEPAQPPITPSQSSREALTRVADLAERKEQELIARAGTTQKAQLSVRPSTYRDKSGYAIRGKDTRGRQVSVFAQTREAADHIRQKIAAGEEITLADFTGKKGGSK